ncbi:MAG TPA: hypothetical protein VMT38_05900 [Terracidiphilus sp.]|nr:hypothetical protein [Terracidiphilus sp.]
MRLRTKLCLGLSVVLFGLFLLAMSAPGQRYLIGTPSPDHWVRDDQVMGAGLAPLVFCLAPSVALLIVSVVLYFSDRRSGQDDRRSSRT